MNAQHIFISLKRILEYQASERARIFITQSKQLTFNVQEKALIFASKEV